MSLTSERIAPYSPEAFDNTEAQVKGLIEHFSFAGMNPDGQVLLTPARTFRDGIVLSGADEGGHSIHFNRDVRIISTDGARATVIDVEQSPARGRAGVLRVYDIEGMDGQEPHVITSSEVSYGSNDAFDVRTPSPDGYIKVLFNPKVVNAATPEVADLLRGGNLGTEEWREFSAAHKADTAIVVHNELPPHTTT